MAGALHLQQCLLLIAVSLRFVFCCFCGIEQKANMIAPVAYALKYGVLRELPGSKRRLNQQREIAIFQCDLAGELLAGK